MELLLGFMVKILHSFPQLHIKIFTFVHILHILDKSLNVRYLYYYGVVFRTLNLKP
jgi:hypothetical protein